MIARETLKTAGTGQVGAVSVLSTVFKLRVHAPRTPQFERIEENRARGFQKCDERAAEAALVAF